MSGGPIELVLLSQVNRKVVSSGKTLVTHVALVARNKIPLDEHTGKRKQHTLGSSSLPEGAFQMGEALRLHLMLSFVVDLHGADGARRVRAADRVTAVGGLTGVGVQVFPQVHQVFTTVVEVKCFFTIRCELSTLFCIDIIITWPGSTRYYKTMQ